MRSVSWSASCCSSFGLQWLRKAILRASGFKALHDEDEIFLQEREEAGHAARDVRLGLDWYSFASASKECSSRA